MISDAINLISSNKELGILFVPLIVALIDKKFGKKSSKKSESKESVKSNTNDSNNTYIDKQLIRANINAMQVLGNKIENSKYKL